MKRERYMSLTVHVSTAEPITIIKEMFKILNSMTLEYD